MEKTVHWPDAKGFAFSIFDDTDDATLENVSGIYDFLAESGFRTSKSCWSASGDPQKGKHPGETLENREYAQWLLELRARGFEIGWHGSTWHGSRRAETLAGLERFAEIFHCYPDTATNHSTVEESMYWGNYRLSGFNSLLYDVLTRFGNHGRYRGHIEGDEYFWGDLCKEKIKYFRNFVFQDINTLKYCPWMPYHDPDKPFVNHWFSSSDGDKINRFNSCISEENQDRLEAEGGACIMYTHFANGFSENKSLNPRFRDLMTRLSRKNGWFVPVNVLLDHLLQVNDRREITPSERRRLERKWLLEKIFIGST